MIRYRPAINRPGRNRPSPNWNSAELGWRDVELRDEGGFGGSGEVRVTKSSVATSSEFETGRPQDAQKRALSNISIPQLAHLAIQKNSRYSLPQALGFWSGPRLESHRAGRTSGRFLDAPTARGLLARANECVRRYAIFAEI